MATSSDEIYQTTFLIQNLHCPSCVANIEGAVYALEPKPVSLSHSIISHSVTINHLPELPIALICAAFEDAGYDIDSVHCDARSDVMLPFDDLSWKEKGKGNQSAWGLPLFRRSSGDEDMQSKKRKRHIENCELCQSKRLDLFHEKTHRANENELLYGKASISSDTIVISKDVVLHHTTRNTAREDSANQLVAVRTAPTTHVFEAEFSIEGMSCASCVNSITKALKAKPWIQDVGVNLITHSGVVRFHGDHKVEDVVEIVEDVGFEATIQRVNEVPTPHVNKLANGGNIWKASLAIGGMTCSSCSSAITTAVKQLPWVKKIDVNLLVNSATVLFEGKDHLNEITTTIEDIGYDAVVDSVSDASQEVRKDTRRKIAIQIDGMYCEHCPGRIQQALDSFGSLLSIEKSATVERPILNISYVPNAPELTIRKILGSIPNADSALESRIYHPLSIEERSRMMQAREQTHILARVILTLITAIPTFIIGIVYMDLVSSNNSNQQYLMEDLHSVSRAEWALFIMATPVYFFAADIFHRRTIKELRALWRPKSPVPIFQRFVRFGSMNMLVSLGTSIAYWSSVAILIISVTRPNADLNDNDDFYFDSVVFLTMFLLIGRLIEAYSKAKTGDAIALLGKLRPTEALLVNQGSEAEEEDDISGVEKVPIDLLDFGDVVRILRGSSPPCDGTVINGESKFDESSLTGEARLVNKRVGDQVFAGTLNQGGALSIRVTGAAGASMLDQIMKVVREGQTRRAPVERLADLITGHFVPFVTLVAILTWVIWLALGLSGTLPDSYLDTNVGSWPYWSLQFAIAVFVVACPCGIGLAAPTALFVGGGLAAKHGILVKGGGEAFQEASNLDIIVFDKTGTLTLGGDPVVTDHEFLLPDGILSEADLLGLTKKLEEDSAHPIAKAIVSFCQSTEMTNVKLTQSSEIPGRGMQGSFTLPSNSSSTTDLLIGNESLMHANSISIPSSTSTTLTSWKKASKSIVLVATKTSSSATWHLAFTFAISDPIRPEAPSIISALHNRNLAVWMLSGDNPDTAQAVGAELGIPASNIIAGVLPSEKADKINYLQRSQNRKGGEQGRAIVAMIGDGINDSPALSTADVGIAIGSGSDVAISAASFVLVSSNLEALLILLDLSRAVFRRIKFNFGWALVYNCVGLPVAAGVLYPIVSGGSHVRLNPVWAALAMALSSVSVVSSSLLLRTRMPVVGFRDGKGKGKGRE